MAMNRSTILIVDDEPMIRELLNEQLGQLGYTTLAAASGDAALTVLDGAPVDVVLTDLNMPGMSGIDLCRRIKADARFAFLPVILLTGISDLDSRVAGLAAGADDFFAKPVDAGELRTRIRVLARFKALLDRNQHLYETVRAQAAELVEHQRTLERRIQEQLGQLERLGRLRRFLARPLAELILNSGADDPLRTHRSDVTVVFVDLRGFTSFTDTSEPEEVMTVLHEYHAEMGRLIVEHEGTLERYTGDGMMILFNDPLPVPNPVERAIRMALAMRERERALSDKWHRRGFNLNFGLGIAQGYATIGKIGFEDRWDYTAIGTVVNLAARLCGVARAGEVLIPESIFAAMEPVIEADPVGEFELKGFNHRVRAYRVLRMKE
jgi:adenylate cyclase